MITSVHNRHVAMLRSLRKRRMRDATGTFLVEGYRELRRARGTLRIRTVYFSLGLWLGVGEPALLAALARDGAETIELAEVPFRRVSLRDRPDGLLAVATQPATDLARLLLPPRPLLLVAESVERPGNLGTLLRTADAAGASAVISCDPVTDPFHPSAVRASIGSLFAVPFAVADTAATLRLLAAAGVEPVAATPSARRPCWDVDLRGPVALVVGSERHGLSPAWAGARQVRIPMAGVNDSLNVAMAAGILLFEAVRQRAAGAAGRRPSVPEPDLRSWCAPPASAGAGGSRLGRDGPRR